MKKIKSFFSICLKIFFPDNYKRALVQIIFFGLCAMVIAFIFENINCADGEFLSTFFGKHLRAHDDGKSDIFYTLYYLIYYGGIMLYVLSSLFILGKRETKGWCAVLIIISVIFLLASNAWLTITLEYDENARLYQSHMLCNVSISTIFSSFAGAKMNDIIKEAKEREVEKIDG